jgi:hypothetical protein
MPDSLAWFTKRIFILGLIAFVILLAGCQKYHRLEKEIPVYSGSSFEKTFRDSSNKQKEHELWIAKAAIEDVSKFYQDQLAEKKWKKQMIVPSPDGSGYALAYSKKNKLLTIVVFARAGAENETYIDLSVVKTGK